MLSSVNHPLRKLMKTKDLTFETCLIIISLSLLSIGYFALSFYFILGRQDSDCKKGKKTPGCSIL
jgi:hypothetical protein